jgi:hypothetical protein
LCIISPYGKFKSRKQRQRQQSISPDKKKGAADNESTAPLLFTRSLYKNHNFVSSCYDKLIQKLSNNKPLFFVITRCNNIEEILAKNRKLGYIKPKI